MLREDVGQKEVTLIKAIDTSQLVNQAIRKKQMINLKAEEEEKKAQILQIQKQLEKQEAEPQSQPY